MQLIDTHAHIYLPDFDADRPALFERATANGITHILMPGIDRTTHPQMLALTTAQPICSAMMGLHPCSVKEDYKQELAIVKAFLKQQHFIAIGEIGLDFYWDKTFTDQQYESFETQIQWAAQYAVPIVIHSRSALDECIDVVRRYPGARGVFHCFSGTVAQAQQIIELGFYLGIGGVVTYKKSGLDSVIEAIGLDRVVLETDAPYLTPVPHRGKRNESSYLLFIAQRLAEVTRHRIEDVAAITTQNAVKLFRLT